MALRRLPTKLTHSHVQAILEEVGPEDYPLTVHATLRVGKGVDSMRWNGTRVAPNPETLADIVWGFHTAYHCGGDDAPLVNRRDLPELYRHRRKVIEKAEREYTKAGLKIKSYLERRTIPASTFGRMAYVDICLRDWGTIKEAVYELLADGKVPNQKRVPLESAKWGLKRNWAVRNIRQLEKKCGMKLRCHSVKPGVIIERLE